MKGFALDRKALQRSKTRELIEGTQKNRILPDPESFHINDFFTKGPQKNIALVVTPVRPVGCSDRPTAFSLRANGCGHDNWLGTRKMI